MTPKNVRLKRLLDMKRRALELPKERLSELEDEYMDLLSRIESEYKRLNIDEESIERFIADTAASYRDRDTDWLMENIWGKDEIKEMENLIRRTAKNGDINDCEYYKKKLVYTWSKIKSDSKKHYQMNFF